MNGDESHLWFPWHCYLLLYWTNFQTSDQEMTLAKATQTQLQFLPIPTEMTIIWAMDGLVDLKIKCARFQMVSYQLQSLLRTATCAAAALTVDALILVA